MDISFNPNYISVENVSAQAKPHTSYRYCHAKKPNEQLDLQIMRIYADVVTYGGISMYNQGNKILYHRGKCQMARPCNITKSNLRIYNEQEISQLKFTDDQSTIRKRIMSKNNITITTKHVGTNIELYKVSNSSQHNRSNDVHIHTRPKVKHTNQVGPNANIYNISQSENVTHYPTNTQHKRSKDAHIHIRRKVRYIDLIRPNANRYYILQPDNNTHDHITLDDTKATDTADEMHNRSVSDMTEHNSRLSNTPPKHESTTGRNNSHTADQSQLDITLENKFDILRHADLTAHEDNISGDGNHTTLDDNNDQSTPRVITMGGIDNTIAVATYENKIKDHEPRQTRKTRWDTPTPRSFTPIENSNIIYWNIPYKRKRQSTEKLKKKPTKKAHMKVALWNAQSLRNKIEITKQYLLDEDLDMLLVTESRIKESGDDEIIGKLQPPGYKLQHYPRSNKDGGGVGIIYKENLNIKLPKHPPVKSMEMMEVLLTTKNKKQRFILIYRAEPSPGNKYKKSDFYEDLTKIMTYYDTFNDETIYCGDFNHHMNKPHKSDVKKLNEVITTFDKHQHVTEPTHEKGNTLDLIITNPHTSLISHKVDIQASDHNIILMELKLEKPPRPKKIITFRKIKDIDTVAFVNDVSQRIKDIDLDQNLQSLVDIYNDTLTNVLDKHAPLQTKEITMRENTPWTNEEIKPLKTKRRRLEKRSRQTGLMVHKQALRNFNREYSNYLDNRRAESYAKLIEDNSEDPKTLFKVINKAIHRKQDNPMPQGKTNQELADEFADFFTDKIANIRTKIEQDPLSNTPQVEQKRYKTELRNFNLLTEENVRKLLMKSSNKHCELDPIPTTLLKLCIEDLLPLITKIINLSLTLGDMPHILKDAIIKPLLKKLGLELINKNYRPVSNLAFISKLIERAVSDQLIEHLKINNLHDKLQSAYRQHHSTETALLKAKNDIMMIMDKQQVTLLLLLDLSAAFDTIDHEILLNRMEKRCGITGTALKWFRSYLTGRNSHIRVGQNNSTSRPLEYGVPQGSVLGPILFCIYTAPLGEIIEKSGLHRQCYADDTGLYTTINPVNTSDAQYTVRQVGECALNVKTFLLQNKLMVNDDKTIFMLLGSSYWLKKLDMSSFQMGEVEIKAADDTRNLGIIFDKEMNFEKHISTTCGKGYYHVKNLYQLNKFLKFEHRKVAAHSFVTSILDYGNSLLCRIPWKQIYKLQMVQNAAAKTVMKKRKFDHISKDRKELLHWLPIEARIKFKINLLTWKCLNYNQPTYLRELLRLKRVSTRSQYRGLLEIPKTKRPTWGDRAFQKAAPELWNELPNHVRNQDKLAQFKKSLKTHLFDVYGKDIHLKHAK